MYVHRLNPSDHHYILSQGRTDPVTGEPLKAGDEIVFCASCKSAFLRESWEYMGEEHCGQQKTLKYFPKAEHLALEWQPLEEVFRLNRHVKFTSPFTILSMFFGFASGMALVSETISLETFSLIASGYCAIGLIEVWRGRNKIGRLDLFKNGMGIKRALSRKKEHRKFSEVK
ncbi:MAG: hypothetical protein AAF740_14290, partial [Bacteroidota bacterium]